MDQFLHMLHTPFGRCIGKSCNSVFLQSHTLDFQKQTMFSLLQIKVKPGIAVSGLRTD